MISQPLKLMSHGHLPPDTVTAITEGYEEWKGRLDLEELECLAYCENQLIRSFHNFATKSAAELMVQVLLQIRRDRVRASKLD